MLSLVASLIQVFSHIIRRPQTIHIRRHTHVCKYIILLITWERAPARKTMTIYIDDDWNACAPVRKMTWVNQLSGYETRQRTEALMTAGSLCTASDRKNAARSLYAKVSDVWYKCSTRASAIIEKKTPVIANVMTGRVVTSSRTANTLTSRFQLQLSIVIDLTDRCGMFRKENT